MKKKFFEGVQDVFMLNRILVHEKGGEKCVNDSCFVAVSRENYSTMNKANNNNSYYKKEKLILHCSTFFPSVSAIL